MTKRLQVSLQALEGSLNKGWTENHLPEVRDFLIEEGLLEPETTGGIHFMTLKGVATMVSYTRGSIKRIGLGYASNMINNIPFHAVRIKRGTDLESVRDWLVENNVAGYFMMGMVLFIESPHREYAMLRWG